MVRKITNLTEGRKKAEAQLNLDLSGANSEILSKIKDFYPDYDDDKTNTEFDLETSSNIEYTTLAGDKKVASKAEFLRDAIKAAQQFISSYKSGSGYAVSYEEVEEALQEALTTHISPNTKPNLQKDTLFFKFVLLAIIGGQINVKKAEALNYEKGLDRAITMFYTHKDEQDIYLQSLSTPVADDPLDYLKDGVLPRLTFGDKTHNTLHSGYGDNNADFKATVKVPAFSFKDNVFKEETSASKSSTLFEVKYSEKGTINPGARMHNAQYLIFCTDTEVTKHILFNGNIYPAVGTEGKEYSWNLQLDEIDENTQKNKIVPFIFNSKTGVVKTYTKRLVVEDFISNCFPDIYKSLLTNTSKDKSICGAFLAKIVH